MKKSQVWFKLYSISYYIERIALDNVTYMEFGVIKPHTERSCPTWLREFNMYSFNIDPLAKTYAGT